MGAVAQMLGRLAAARDSGDLAELCRRHGVELMVLFGSAATREPRTREPQDIDLAIAFLHDEHGDLLAVADDLAELLGGDRLDVMDLASAGPVAMQRALTTGEVLYAQTPQSFTERQIFAINHYIETEPLRRALLESLTR